GRPALGQAGLRTGLYACIFFASGKKGYRSNPLRVPKSGVPAGFWHRSLPQANSIYPPPADSNGNNGIPAALQLCPKKVPGTLFLDKNLSGNLVPGTPGRLSRLALFRSGGCRRFVVIFGPGHC
ncbi:MAG: hypothetical protein LBK05_08080, partial [Treponema sp.]|nr:hypothetical protein [Treponema sp.]